MWNKLSGSFVGARTIHVSWLVVSGGLWTKRSWVLIILTTNCTPQSPLPGCTWPQIFVLHRGHLSCWFHGNFISATGISLLTCYCASIPSMWFIMQRITAPPSDSERSRLSIMAQHLCHIQKGFIIKGQTFVPPPKVWIIVISILWREQVASFPDFISQPWKKIRRTPRLWDKIWEWLGNEVREWVQID